MRTGEVLALTWDDIDFESRKIIVNKTVYPKIKDDVGRWFLGSTKTEGSCREVYINNTLLKALKNYKNKQKCYQKEYGKDYCYYHLESVENKYGKALEYRIIETTENYYISSSEESIKIASEKFEQTVQSKIIDEIIKYDTTTKKNDKL